jgi:hypothetical protein
MARKTQGYNSRLDESLGARNRGKKKQSLASRRRESEGTEESMGRRKYSAVSTMDRKADGGDVKKKRQGYNDRLDESLGERNGKKSQSLKSRRDESKGTEKAMGRRAYAAVGTMDKGGRKSSAKRVVNLGAGGPVGRSTGSADNSSNTPQHKLLAMGKSVPQGKSPVRMRGGGSISKKMKRGGAPGGRGR